MIISDLIKNAISLYYCRHKYTQDFFVASPADIKLNEQNPGRRFYDVDNIDDYKKLCEQYGFKAHDADEEKRFKNKSHFCVLDEDDHFGCWGWYHKGESKFYVLEIDKKIIIPENAAVLYHFFTNENYRRRGYYTELLQNIVLHCGRNYAIIYAYGTNMASTGAIKKAGFRFVGRYGHKDFPGYERLIEDYVSGVVKN